jgi:hypothetical protein
VLHKQQHFLQLLWDFVYKYTHSNGWGHAPASEHPRDADSSQLLQGGRQVLTPAWQVRANWRGICFWWEAVYYYVNLVFVSRDHDPVHHHFAAALKKKTNQKLRRQWKTLPTWTRIVFITELFNNLLPFWIYVPRRATCCKIFYNKLQKLERSTSPTIRAPVFHFIGCIKLDLSLTNQGSNAASLKGESSIAGMINLASHQSSWNPVSWFIKFFAIAWKPTGLNNWQLCPKHLISYLWYLMMRQASFFICKGGQPVVGLCGVYGARQNFHMYSPTNKCSSPQTHLIWPLQTFNLSGFANWLVYSPEKHCNCAPDYQATLQFCKLVWSLNTP